jgi:chemotaxis-related protein WspB
MLVLMCEAAGIRFAVDACQVVEVVARVRLQSVPGSPDWLAGVCVYRGRVTPVMELSKIVASKPSPACWANRIIMVRLTEEAASSLCGLIVENVAIGQLAAEPTKQDAPSVANVSQWGPLLLDAQGIFQLLELPRLFSAQRLELLRLT